MGEKSDERGGLSSVEGCGSDETHCLASGRVSSRDKCTVHMLTSSRHAN